MKLKQIICIALISSFFFSGCGSSNNSEIIATEKISTESTTLTFTVTEVTTQEIFTQNTIPKNDIHYSKDTYRKQDEAIWKYYTILSSINILTIDKLNQYLNDKSYVDELYALVKKNKDVLSTNFEYLTLETFNNEPYWIEVKNYSNCLINVSDNIMKFIENSDISYLEKSLSIFEESTESSKNILSERIKYLEHSGFTQDEIKYIISEPISSANE